MVFGNFDYRYTWSRQLDDVTRLQPRNLAGFSLGYAFALNEMLTLGSKLLGTFTSETECDNAVLPQRELFTLEFSMTTWLTHGLYLEPTVAFGLNGDDNRFVLGLSLPYTPSF